MAKTIFEEMGGTYTQVGDYLLPDLKLPKEEQQPIGVWGQRHRRYLKEHRRATYATLLTSGKLNSYLADIERQIKQLPCRHRPASRGDVSSAGKTAGRSGRHHRNAKSRRSDGLGRQDELHTRQSYGNCK